MLGGMGRFSVPTYRDTPGLQNFPPERQFLIYRMAHRKLLDGDPVYRRACLRYTLLVVGLCFVTLVLQILQILDVVSPAVTIGAGIASMILVVVGAFRAQRYRNLRISWELQQQEAGKV